MNFIKKVIAICVIIAALSSLLLLTSCGATSANVKYSLEKMKDANSYTCFWEEDGEDMVTVKIDLKNNRISVLFEANEQYLWYDEEEDTCYQADFSLNDVGEGEQIQKEAISAAEYVEAVSEVLEKVKLDGFLEVLDLWSELDGEYYYSNDEEGVSYVLGYDEQGNLKKTVTKDGAVESCIYCDINKTTVEIPQRVLDAQ